MTPALFTRMCTLPIFAVIRVANSRTDSREARSSSSQTMLVFFVASTSSFRVRRHFLISLQAMMTLAPLFANSRAVSFPSPVLDPVTITFLPFSFSSPV
uniref:Putative secreted protein n=1 Tax=Ixodes ricinus TaxID=34613 RepID=A0A6B0UI67_IXORI